MSATSTYTASSSGRPIRAPRHRPAKRPVPAWLYLLLFAVIGSVTFVVISPPR